MNLTELSTVQVYTTPLRNYEHFPNHDMGKQHNNSKISNKKKKKKTKKQRNEKKTKVTADILKGGNAVEKDISLNESFGLWPKLLL